MMGGKMLVALVLVCAAALPAFAAESTRDLKTFRHWKKKWPRHRDDNDDDDDKDCYIAGRGRYGSGGGCSPCPYGTYSAEGEAKCNPCPPGYTTQTSGCHHSSQCVPGGSPVAPQPSPVVPQPSPSAGCPAGEVLYAGECFPKCPEGSSEADKRGGGCTINESECNSKRGLIKDNKGNCVCDPSKNLKRDKKTTKCVCKPSYILTDKANNKCTPPGTGGADDPIFYGFNRHRYAFNGLGGHVYSLLSEQDMQLNAQMIDVTEVKKVEGESKATYFGAMAFQYHTDRVLVRPEFGSKIDVTVNSIHLELTDVSSSTQVSLPDGTLVKLWSANKHVPDVVMIATPKMSLVITGTGHHLNFNINHMSAGLCEMHGVLGQTYSGKPTDHDAPIENTFKPEGADADYEVSGLFAFDSKFNRFGMQPTKCFESVEMNTNAGTVEEAAPFSAVAMVARKARKLL
jgi:hypothetical protein